MKRAIIIALALLMVSGAMAFAEQTDYSWFHRHGYTDENSFLADRYCEFEKKRDNPLGIGLDLTLYEFEGDVQKYGLDTVELQNKWDVRNGEYSGFVVITANPYRVIRDWLLK